jgi:hypothetical protein
MVNWSGRRWLTVLVACFAVAITAVGVAGWSFRPWREKYVVPVLPPSASARQVVLAYLRALDAHDSATAYAVSAPDFKSTASLWLDSTARLTRIWVGKVQYYSKEPPRGYSLERSHDRFLIVDDGTP